MMAKDQAARRSLLEKRQAIENYGNVVLNLTRGFGKSLARDFDRDIGIKKLPHPLIVELVTARGLEGFELRLLKKKVEKALMIKKKTPISIHRLFMYMTKFAKYFRIVGDPYDPGTAYIYPPQRPPSPRDPPARLTSWAVESLQKERRAEHDDSEPRPVLPEPDISAINNDDGARVSSFGVMGIKGRWSCCFCQAALNNMDDKKCRTCGIERERSEARNSLTAKAKNANQFQHSWVPKESEQNAVAYRSSRRRKVTPYLTDFSTQPDWDNGDPEFCRGHEVSNLVEASREGVVQWLSACHDGDVDYLKIARRRENISLNCHDGYGRTGFHLAAAEGRLEVYLH